MERLLHFSKSCLRRCFERKEALEITAKDEQVVGEGRDLGDGIATGKTLFKSISSIYRKFVTLPIITYQYVYLDSACTIYYHHKLK